MTMTSSCLANGHDLGPLLGTCAIAVAKGDLAKNDRVFPASQDVSDDLAAKGIAARVRD